MNPSNDPADDESYVTQCCCEVEIEQLEAKREQLVAAVTRARKQDPNAKAIPRAIEIIADLDAQLQDLSVELLRVTPVDRRFPN